MEDVAKETTRIYAMLEDQEVAYQVVVVKVEGKISKQSNSILIDPRSTHSYENPKVVESC